MAKTTTIPIRICKAGGSTMALVLQFARLVPRSIRPNAYDRHVTSSWIISTDGDPRRINMASD